jgi:hypothetical protein
MIDQRNIAANSRHRREKHCSVSDMLGIDYN